MKSRLLSLSVAGTALLTGCAYFNGAFAPDAGGPAIAERSGTRAEYGVGQEVLDTVEAVRSAGDVRQLSSRAVRLPTRELQSFTVFDYTLPESCGGYAFRVYDSGITHILEYSYERPDGGTSLIRDYIAGRSPFMTPGLWSSYDHTADSVTHMMTLFAETESRLAPRVYSRGLMTGLAEMTQEELGLAYRDAVRAASVCVEIDSQASSTAAP
jgi:hypothetical protein